MPWREPATSREQLSSLVLPRCDGERQSQKSQKIFKDFHEDCLTLPTVVRREPLTTCVNNGSPNLEIANFISPRGLTVINALTRLYMYEKAMPFSVISQLRGTLYDYSSFVEGVWRYLRFVDM